MDLEALQEFLLLRIDKISITAAFISVFLTKSEFRSFLVDLITNRFQLSTKDYEKNLENVLNDKQKAIEFLNQVEKTVNEHE